MSSWDDYYDDDTEWGSDAPTQLNQTLDSIYGVEDTGPKPYVSERGFFGDVGSNLARGFTDLASLSGHALDQFGIETGLEEWAANAQEKYSFLMPDVSEYGGREGWLKRSFTGALRSAPASLTPFVTGAAGALAGSAVAPGAGTAGGAIGGFGAGAATLIGLFGAGTYNQTYREAIDKGLDAGAAKKLALETAAWEVGTEGLSDMAAVVTGGLLGAPVKGATKTLFSRQSIKPTLENILQLGPLNMARRAGATVSAEVGSEVLNAYMQNSAQRRAGLDPGMSGTEAMLEAIGPALFLSGGITIGTQSLGNRRRNAIVKVLTSPDTSRTQKAQVSEVVYENLAKENPEWANNWQVAANHILENGGTFDINQDFVEQASGILRSDTAKKGEVLAEQQEKELDQIMNDPEQYVFNQLVRERAPIEEQRAQVAARNKELDALLADYEVDVPGTNPVRDTMAELLGYDQFIAGEDADQKTAEKVSALATEAGGYEAMPTDTGLSEAEQKQLLAQARRFADAAKKVEPGFPMDEPGGYTEEQLAEFRKKGEEPPAPTRRTFTNQDLEEAILANKNLDRYQPDLPPTIQDKLDRAEAQAQLQREMDEQMGTYDPELPIEMIDLEKARILLSSEEAPVTDEEIYKMNLHPALISAINATDIKDIQARGFAAVEQQNLGTTPEIGTEVYLTPEQTEEAKTRLTELQNRAAKEGKTLSSADQREMEALQIQLSGGPQDEGQAAKRLPDTPAQQKKRNRLVSALDDFQSTAIPLLEKANKGEMLTGDEYVRLDEAKKALDNAAGALGEDPRLIDPRMAPLMEAEAGSPMEAGEQFAADTYGQDDTYQGKEAAVETRPQETWNDAMEQAFKEVAESKAAKPGDRLAKVFRALEKSKDYTLPQEVADAFETIGEQIFKTHHKKKSSREKTVEWALTRAIAEGDVATTNELLSHYRDKGSQKNAAIEAALRVRQALDGSKETPATKQIVENVVQAIDQNFTTEAQRSRDLQFGPLSFDIVTHNQMYTGVNNETGQKYLLWRKPTGTGERFGRWRLTPIEKGADGKMIEGKSLTGKTKDDPEQFVRRAVKSLGIDMWTKAELPANTKGIAGNRRVKTYYDTDGVHVVVPHTKGWTVVTRENLESWNQLSAAEQKDARFLKTGYSLEDAKKAAEKLNRQTRSAYTEKLTAESPTRKAFVAENLASERLDAAKAKENEELYGEHTGKVKKALGKFRRYYEKNPEAVYRLKRGRIKADQEKLRQLQVVHSKIVHSIEAGKLSDIQVLRDDISSTLGAKSFAEAPRNIQAQVDNFIESSFGTAYREYDRQYKDMIQKYKVLYDETTSQALLDKVDDMLVGVETKRQRLADLYLRMYKWTGNAQAAARQRMATSQFQHNPLLAIPQELTAELPPAMQKRVKAEAARVKQDLERILPTKQDLPRAKADPNLPSARFKQTVPIQPRPEIGNTMGPLFQYKGESIWRSPQGHIIRRTGKKSGPKKFSVRFPDGTQGFTGSLAAFAKQHLPAPRTVEDVASVPEQKAWKEYQKSKQLPPQEAAKKVLPAFNGWTSLTPGVYQNTNGNFIGKLKSNDDAGPFIPTHQWIVTDTRTGKEVAYYGSAGEMMASIHKNLTPKAKNTSRLFAIGKEVPAGTHSSDPKRVEEKLVKHLGEAGVQRWQNILQIVPDVSQASGIGQEIRERGIEGPVLGYYNPDNNSLTLIANAIPKGKEVDIFYHEALHYVVENDATFMQHKQGIKDRIKKLRNRKNTAMAAAWSQAEQNNPYAEDVYGSKENWENILAEEAYAYFVQNPANRNTDIISKFFNAIRRILVKLRIPGGMMGLSEADLSIMATRSIMDAKNRKLEEPVGKAFGTEVQLNTEVLENKLKEPEFVKFWNGSKVRQGNLPKVLYHTSAAPSVIPDQTARTLDTYQEAEDSLLPFLGINLRNDQSTFEDAEQGAIHGFYAQAREPLYITKKDLLKGMDSTADAIAKKRRIQDLMDKPYDSIFVVDSYNENAKVERVILFNDKQIQPADKSWSTADLSRMRFASGDTAAQLSESKDRSLPDDKLSAHTVVQDTGRRKKSFAPITPDTPTDSKGNPRSDYAYRDKKTGQHYLYERFDQATQDYSSKQAISEQQFEARSEEWNIEAQRQKAEYFSTHQTPLKQHLLTGASKRLSEASAIAKKYLGTINDQLWRISKDISGRNRYMEAQIHFKQKEYTDRLKPFMSKYQKLDRTNQEVLDQALRNSDHRMRDRMLLSSGMDKEFRAAMDVLNEIGRDAIEVGLMTEEQLIEEYFPRVIRAGEVDGLVKAMAKEQGKGDLTKAEIELAQMRETAEREGKIFQPGDELAHVMKILNTGNYQFIPKPGASKERTVRKVRDEHAMYYEDSLGALQHHIYDMVQAIEGRRMLGKSASSRPTEMNRLSRLVKKIDKLEQNKDRSEEQQEILNGLWEQYEDISAKLSNVDADLEGSITDFVTKEIKLGNEQAIEAINLIRSRLTQRGMSGLPGKFRDIGYMMTLGSPMSAITQIGDVALTASAHNPINTAAGVFRAATSLFSQNKGLTKEFFDFSYSLGDFSRTGIGNKGTQWALDKILTASGLKKMDLFGKETFMQAASQRLGRMDKKKFVEKYTYMFHGVKKGTAENAAKRAYDQIKSKDFSSKEKEGLIVLFNELSMWQPTTLSDMPAGYNTAGNARIFYMLKSFNIRSLNAIHREVVDKWRDGNKVAAARQAAWMISLLSLAGAGTDEIKDWILGREDASFKDNVHDQLLKIMLMNRFSIDRGLQQGNLVSTLVNTQMPPLRHFDYMADDAYKFMFDRDKFKAKSINNIPLVGRFIYESSGPGQQSQLERLKSALNDEIKKNAREGKSMYSGRVRELLKAHNTMASDLGEDLVKYNTIKNTRKRELKKLRETQ